MPKNSYLITGTLFLLAVVAFLVVYFFLQPRPKDTLKLISIQTKSNLSLSIPDSITKTSDTARSIFEDENVDFQILRINFTDDPSKTGGDFCSGGGVTKEQLTLVGTVDGKEVFRKDDAYFAERAGVYCTIMPLFTKKYPDYDGIKVNFTFKSPDLSDLEKQKYSQIADQIVLSLKDTAKQ